MRIEVPDAAAQTVSLLLLGGDSGEHTKMIATPNQAVLTLSFTKPTNVVEFDLWSPNVAAPSPCTVTVHYLNPAVPDTQLPESCRQQFDPATEVSIGPGPDIAALTIATTNPSSQTAMASSSSTTSGSETPPRRSPRQSPRQFPQRRQTSLRRTRSSRSSPPTRSSA